MNTEQVINSNNKTQWEPEDGYRSFDDPLLGCLTILSKILNKPHSPDSLTAGLPLVDNRLTPGLFSRAAERAGLSYEREGNVPENELGQAFNRQSLSKRMAIVVAGPAANLAFAVMAYWFLFVVGIPGIKPIVAEVAPQSIVAQAGMVSGDEILQIDGRDTPTWNSAFKALLPFHPNITN